MATLPGMKTNRLQLRAPPRLALVFLLAFLLLTMVLAWMTLRTFMERRQAVQKLLELGLWSASDNAVRSLEDHLAELERQSLNRAEQLAPLPNQNPFAALREYLAAANSCYGYPFLLDENKSVLLPRIVDDRAALDLTPSEPDNSPYAQCLREAEQVEFSRKDLLPASDQSNSFLAGLCSGPVRPATISALK
jgi:hypothetical protein